MKKILVIDDDRSVVDVVCQALEGDDRSIRRAYDGQAARNWIEKEVFDLVVCDLMLPQAHGLQIVEGIRAKAGSSGTRILILSAKSYQRDVDKARQAGADEFISKPFEIKRFVEKVKEIIPL